MEKKLALRTCTITGRGAATNRAFSVLISGLPAKAISRAIPAVKGIALIDSSTSGTFQSIRVAFVIQGVYERPLLL
jgi:hypothetical protein